MKKLLLFVLIISNSVFATEKEKEINSTITKATVFLSGAQVNREGRLTIPKGKTTLKFKALSPYIDKNSIKVKGVGNFTILSVNHSVDWLTNPSQSEQSVELTNKIDELELDVEYKKTEEDILNEKLNFLTTNKKIISNEKTTSPSDFKLFKDIYSSDYESIQISLLKKQREINALNKKIKTLEKQIQEMKSVKNLPTSEITVIIASKIETKGKLDLSYYVSNAGWYPSYDIRVDDISSPVKLSYKANVYQNTGIDWKNVKLTFSNASPTESANIPTLYPYYLDFYTYETQASNNWYNPNIREVRGVVRDKDTKEAVPFATIKIKDKTIGTTTDYDGKFTLTIPHDAKYLQVSFVGYGTEEVSISNSYMNISLEATSQMMEEVTVTALGISRQRISRKDKKEIQTKSNPIPLVITDHKTNFEFNIATSYTLKSNSNNLTIEMKEIELNSSYVYKSIPKINNKAFLISNVIDWEQHSLLDGEVNLYFENTYVGKSVLDMAQLSDTLEVSLGSDKGISIKRIKEKDLNSKQFLGSNKIETRIWKTTIRNNKSEKVRLFIYDQVPISNNEDITVDVKNLSDGVLNTENGEVVWEIELEPKESIDKIIEYSVKYPKKSTLRID